MKTDYNVGIYCRLSKDDNTTDESVSIQNQKAMLINYTLERGWNLTKIYIDDGYTGTNFDRPDFKQMIADIEQGKINMVLTKDLSRLGRNYVLTGQYTEGFFPEHGVRYIAVNDNIDTLNEDNDIAPFKNILNEYYAKDISRKVRSTKKVLAEQGKFANSRPSFGYMKSPEDKHKLIIDEEAAPIVRRIYKLFLGGKSARNIADILNKENVPTPNAYYYASLNKPNPKNQSNHWGSGTIMNILKNPVYKGDIVQGRKTNLSYKSKKIIYKPSDEWIVVENTHEPIIERSAWAETQEFIQKNHTRVRRCASGEISLFSGIVKCADCGKHMDYNRKVYKSYVKEYYRCGQYVNKGKTACSCHTIRQEHICQAVLADLREYAKLAYVDEAKLVNRLFAENEQQNRIAAARYEKQIKQKSNRHKEIVNLVQSLFEEKISGVLSENMFKQMIEKYEAEQAALEKEIENLNKELLEIRKVEMDISGWVTKIKKYLAIETLTREIVLELIDSIEISEVYILDGEKHQDIKITYRFGKIEKNEKRVS